MRAIHWELNIVPILLGAVHFFLADCAHAQQSARPSSCKQLQYYRDNVLRSDWQRITNKAQLFSQAQRELSELATRLDSDTAYARGPGPQIASGVKLVANAVENLISAVAPGGSVVRIAGASTSALATKIYDGIESAQTMAELASVGSADELAKFAVTQAGQLGAWSQTFFDFADDLQQMRDVSEGRLALQAEVSRQARSISTQVAQLQRSYETHMQHAQFLEAFGIAVNRVCSAEASAVITGVGENACRRTAQGQVSSIQCGNGPSEAADKAAPAKKTAASTPSAEEAYERCKNSSNVPACIEEVFR